MSPSASPDPAPDPSNNPREPLPPENASASAGATGDADADTSAADAPRADDPLRGLAPADLLAAGLATETGGPARAGGGGGVGAGENREPPPAPTPEELAAEFPALEIAALVGRGGMGAVYRARQRALDRWVALKVLRPGLDADPDFAERFAREARAMAQLNHPGIVMIFEYGRTAGGRYFIVMELVDGVNLRQLLAAGRLAPREALAIVPPLCDALQYAHDRGLVHRDIKPENILVDRLGRVKIADFGLAKAVGGAAASASAGEGDAVEAAGKAAGGAAGAVDLTEAGRVMGTPRYMAPEQRERPADVDHRADLYALGVVFYQMLTGELPAEGDAHRFTPPSRKVTLDVRLDEIVLRALETEPARRYAAASEFKTQVETVAATLGATPLGAVAGGLAGGGLRGAAPPSGPAAGPTAAPNPVPPSPRPDRRRPIEIWIMTVVGMVVGSFVLAVLTSDLINGGRRHTALTSALFAAEVFALAAAVGVWRLRPGWRKVMLVLVALSVGWLVVDGGTKVVQAVMRGLDPLEEPRGMPLWAEILGTISVLCLQLLWYRWKWAVLRRPDIRARFESSPRRSRPWIEWTVAVFIAGAVVAGMVANRGSRPVDNWQMHLQITLEASAQEAREHAVLDLETGDRLPWRAEDVTSAELPAFNLWWREAPAGSPESEPRSGKPLLLISRAAEFRLGGRWSTEEPPSPAAAESARGAAQGRAMDGAIAHPFIADNQWRAFLLKTEDGRSLLGWLRAEPEGERLRFVIVRYKVQPRMETVSAAPRGWSVEVPVGEVKAAEAAATPPPPVESVHLFTNKRLSRLDRFLALEMELAEVRVRYAEKHPYRVAVEAEWATHARHPVPRNNDYRSAVQNLVGSLEAEQQSLATRYRERHPVMVAVNARLERARALLAEVEAEFAAKERPAEAAKAAESVPLTPASAETEAKQPPAIVPAPNTVTAPEEKTAEPESASRASTPSVFVRVTVLGRINRQGQVSLASPATLLDALAAAGGWERIADLRIVKVRATEGTDAPAETHDVTAVLRGAAPNPVLSDGAVVWMTERVF